MAKPFLKWAGNKAQIADRIRAALPAGARLIEPFAGSGAVFMNTDYPAYLLNDFNPDLVDLFRRIQVDGPAFVEYARTLFTPAFNTREAFLDLRREFNADRTASRRRSALFVYLNRHCFNGLCRYNRGGGFNVPFGKYKQPYFPATEILAFATKAQACAVEFTSGDFEAAMRQARPGDVLYCDPPYLPLSASASFTSYSTDGFGMDAQQRLANAAREMAAQGIPVIISNHHTPAAEALYHGAQIEVFGVRRFISANGDRPEAQELLATFPAAAVCAA